MLELWGKSRGDRTMITFLKWRLEINRQKYEPLAETIDKLAKDLLTLGLVRTITANSLTLKPDERRNREAIEIFDQQILGLKREMDSAIARSVKLLRWHNRYAGWLQAVERWFG